MFAVALWALSRALDRSSNSSWHHGRRCCRCHGRRPNQVALIGVYVLALLVVCHLFAEPKKWRERAWHSVPPLATGAIAGALIVLIPLVLTALFASSTSRASISFDEAARGSLHPASLLTGVIADLFGAFSQSVDYWGPYGRSWNPNELTLAQNMSQVYCGALPAVLIAVAGFGRGWLWRREIRPYVLILGLVILYARAGARIRLFYEYLPGVAVFRRPADATFFIGAFAGIVAGYLLALLANKRREGALFAFQLARPGSHLCSGHCPLSGRASLVRSPVTNPACWPIGSRQPLASRPAVTAAHHGAISGNNIRRGLQHGRSRHQ